MCIPRYSNGSEFCCKDGEFYPPWERILKILWKDGENTLPNVGLLFYNEQCESCEIHDKQLSKRENKGEYYYDLFS